MMRQLETYSVVMVLLFLFCGASSLAASTGSGSDAELVDQADLIVLGRVLEVELGVPAGQPMSTGQVAVDEVLAGTLTASPLTFTVAAAVPLYAGDRVLLFLGEPSSTGEFPVLAAGAGALHLGSLGGEDVACRKLRTAFEASLEAGLAAGEKVVRELDALQRWIRLRRAGAKAGFDGLRTVSAVERAAIEGALPPKVSPFATLTDPLGDNSSVADMLSATVRANATTLFVDVRFRNPGFGPEARVSLSIDADHNPATGRTWGGIGGQIGTDSLINFGGAELGDQARTTIGIGGQTTETGTFPATRTDDSFSFAVPLAAIADDGFFDFKFAAQNGRIAGLVDHMPDWTSPAASTGVGALVAPDGLQATVMSSDQIRLTWNDRSNTEQQFEIERRVGGGSFQLVGTVGANVEAYSDASLAGGMTYTYRVRARSGTQTSDYSAPASASIPSQGEAPPTGLTAQAVSASEIQLGWSDNAGSEDGYRVEMRSTGDFELLQSLPADSTAAAITGLDEATLYTFRVQATGGLGDSSFSNEASAMTFGDVEPCVPGPSTLCLNGGRFKVEIVWSDFAGANGTGIDAGLVSEDSGLLYFFDENNLEMLVKVLDGCAITNHFWVFAAATTDVEYTLTATDTFTGSVKTYSNPLGNASPAITDTEAFATCDAVAPAGKAAPVTTLPASALATGMLAAGATKTAPRSETTGLAPELKQGTCIPGATSLCLNEGRFRVEVDWVTADDVGMGQVDAFQSADSGLLWFFSPNNLEMLVKVLDGCAVNDRVWVFAAATTDVEYTLRVTDTVTGEEKRYLNAAGNAADAITDTDAFAACP